MASLEKSKPFKSDSQKNSQKGSILFYDQIDKCATHNLIMYT